MMKSDDHGTCEESQLECTTPLGGNLSQKETSFELENMEMNDEPVFNPGVGNVLRTYSKLKRKSPKSSPEVEHKKIEQPTPPEKSSEEKSPPTKRSRTFSGSCSTSADMKIYVRLKPLRKEVNFREQPPRYRVVGPELFINLSDVQQDMSKMIDVVAKKFVFSGAFGEEINQSEMFERVVAPQVEKFIGGTSCTVMAYGAKLSGKSYTVNGTPTDPGLIQQTLDRIFSLKEVRSTPSYQPVDNSLKCMTSAERDTELKSRERPCSSSLISRSEGVDALEAVETPTHPHHEVWVSFAEIRDENYFDLLSSDYLVAHSSLKMGIDSEGKGFIKGLKHVFVGSALEAKEVLFTGRDNFSKWHEINKTETTESHRIFTVTLLKYWPLDDAGSVQMSKFSFGVLAAQKSPELDPSLLALISCLESTKNLHLPTPHPQPIECFCPSRLTDLFKDALTGESPFSLVITADPSPEVYLETHGVLHSTSHSTEILTKIRNPHPPKPSTGFGKLAESPQEIVDWEDLTPERLTLLSEAFQDEIASLELLNLRGDVEVRQKTIKRYSKIIERIENFYKRKSEADLHSEDVDALRTVSQKLRSHKQLLERELAVVIMELNEMSGECMEPHDEISNQNPYVLHFEETIAEKEAGDKNERFIKQLNETRGEYLRVLKKIRERERKIVEIERKYMALKMNRECEFMQHRNMNHCFKNQMGILMRLEERLQREKMWCSRFQEDCEGLRDVRKTQTAEGDCEEGQDASMDLEIDVVAGEDRGGAPEYLEGASEEQIVPQISESEVKSSGINMMETDEDTVLPSEVPIDKIPEAEGFLESSEVQSKIPEQLQQNSELITVAEEGEQLENQPLVSSENEKSSTLASEVNLPWSDPALEINVVSEEVVVSESADIPDLDGQLFVPEDRALSPNENSENSNLGSGEICEPEECSKNNDTCNSSAEPLESLEIQDNITSKPVENEQENSQMTGPSLPDLPELESIIPQSTNIAPETSDLSPEAALHLPESLMNISKHELITFAISQSMVPSHELLETSPVEEFPMDTITCLTQQDEITPAIVDTGESSEEMVNTNDNESSVPTSAIEQKHIDSLEEKTLKAKVLESVETSEVGVPPPSESVISIDDEKINIPLVEDSSTADSTLFHKNEASALIKKEPIAVIENLEEQKNSESNRIDVPQTVVKLEQAAEPNLKPAEPKNIDSLDRKELEDSPTTENRFTLLQEKAKAPEILEGNSLGAVESVKDLDNNLNTLSEISQLLTNVHIDTPSPSTSETPSSTSEDSLVNEAPAEVGLISTRSRTRKRSGPSLRTSPRKRVKLFPPDTPTRRSSRKRPQPKYLTVVCDNCNEIIQGEYRYHCIVCLNGGFDLCEKCFKKDKKEKHPHKLYYVPTIPAGFLRG